MSFDFPPPQMPDIAHGNMPASNDQWLLHGFAMGWNMPGKPYDCPYKVIDATRQAIHKQGYEYGQQLFQEAQTEVDASLAGQPAIDVDPGGENYEKAKRRYEEAWQEFLGERHTPHIEIEQEVLEPLPLPNVVFVP